MSLYLDTSCWLKLVLREPESERVRSLALSESRLVVSALTRLEARQTLLAMLLGGEITRAQHRRLEIVLNEMLAISPFDLVRFPPDALEQVEQQLSRAAYCRTLDRLHLAVMESLGLRRLLTNDDQQATAARALGFEVILPR